MTPRLLLCLCTGALALAGCALTPAEQGEQGTEQADRTGQAAELLGTGTNQAAQAPVDDAVRGVNPPPELQQQEPTVGVEDADPDPEPWHGGKRDSNGSGKHD